MRYNRWTVVLAGGEGERLKPLIRSSLGLEKPKQYCALVGEQTLLEETLGRVKDFAPFERTLTVIGRGHGVYLNGSCARAGRVVEQPAKRETAPGIFLPAAHILRADPLATVLIFPSDHFVSAGPAFSRCVDSAADLAEHNTDKIVLLGAVPDAPEQDYGWIEPDWSWSAAGGAMRVARFKEKPEAQEAAALFERGCLWNTMVMAVKIKTLWEMGRLCLPGMMERFDALLPALGTARETSALTAAYRGLGCFNFSKDILELLPDRVMVLPMSGVEWSDLGHPARIFKVLERSSKRWAA